MFVRFTQILFFFIVFISNNLFAAGAIYFAVGESQRDVSLKNVKSGDEILIKYNTSYFGLPGKVITAQCNGLDWVRYYTTFFYRIGVPIRVNVAGQWADVDLVSSGWQYDSTDANYNYYKIFSDTGNWYDGKSCFNVGEMVDMSKFAPGIPNDITVSFRVPPNMPDGKYNIIVPLRAGKSVNFMRGIADLSQKGWSMSVPDSVGSALIGSHTINYISDIQNTIRCKLDNLSYDINHSDMSIYSADGHLSSVNINVLCTGASKFYLNLASVKKINIDNGEFAIDMDNGWGSLIRVDNKEFFTKRLYETVTAGATEINISSKLFKISNKTQLSGNINGSVVVSLEII